MFITKSITKVGLAINDFGNKTANELEKGLRELEIKINLLNYVPLQIRPFLEKEKVILSMLRK